MGYRNIEVGGKENFAEAKAKFIEKIEKEREDPESWTPCTCLGFSHRHGCPEMEGVITF